MGAAGDFDGDGRLDLAFIDEQKQAAFVIYNRGRRQFGLGNQSGFRGRRGLRTRWQLPISITMAGRISWWAMWRRRGRCTSTEARTVFTKSVGMTARAQCMGWRSRISTATAGQTSWLPVLTRRMRSGSAPNQCQADSGGSRRLAAWRTGWVRPASGRRHPIPRYLSVRPRCSRTARHTTRPAAGSRQPDQTQISTGFEKRVSKAGTAGHCPQPALELGHHETCDERFWFDQSFLLQDTSANIELQH